MTFMTVFLDSFFAGSWTWRHRPFEDWIISILEEPKAETTPT